MSTELDTTEVTMYFYGFFFSLQSINVYYRLVLCMSCAKCAFYKLSTFVLVLCFNHLNRGLVNFGKFLLICQYFLHVYIYLVMLYPEIVLYSILINVMNYFTSKNKLFVQICRQCRRVPVAWSASVLNVQYV